MPTPSQGSVDGGREKIIEFACPFLKHDPRRCQQIRSCSAAGWKAVFRLKLVSHSRTRRLYGR